MYAYIVLLHVVGAFVFALSHGVSIAVSLRIGSVTSRDEIRGLLTLSYLSIGGLYVGLVVLLVGGVWAGFAGGHWGRAWIWAALAILVVIMVAMYAIATPFYARMRVAAGIETNPARIERAGPIAEGELEAMAASRRPITLAAIGGIGILVILWLMVVKPF
jgi:hypothetical protein